MNYEIKYTSQAEKEIDALVKSGDKQAVLKLQRLLFELLLHPYMGTGKPKMLSGRLAGYYSRRITQKHRLVYSVNDKKVTVLVISASGHYDDK